MSLVKHRTFIWESFFTACCFTRFECYVPIDFKKVYFGHQVLVFQVTFVFWNYCPFSVLFLFFSKRLVCVSAYLIYDFQVDFLYYVLALSIFFFAEEVFSRSWQTSRMELFCKNGEQLKVGQSLFKLWLWQKLTIFVDVKNIWPPRIL